MGADDPAARQSGLPRDTGYAGKPRQPGKSDAWRSWRARPPGAAGNTRHARTTRNPWKTGKARQPTASRRSRDADHPWYAVTGHTAEPHEPAAVTAR